LAYTRHEPYGVVVSIVFMVHRVLKQLQGVILPWNWPLVGLFLATINQHNNTSFQMLLLTKVAPALATGNTVVIKVIWFILSSS